MAEPEPAPARAGRREMLGLAVIALPCMVYAMDLTVLDLAIPSISRELQPSAVQMLWIADIYGFMVAGMLITMGTLGDRIGRRRLLMIGAAAFGVASVAAAFSTTAAMLIATRALLGVAGATLAPSTLSLIRTMFQDAHQRSIAIGVWVASYSVGAAVGPVLGGLLLEYYWWGSVFLIGVPVMVLLLIAGPLLLPEYRNPDAGSLDLASVALSMAAVIASVYGIKQMAQDGLALLPMLVMAAGIGLGIVFVRRQHRLVNPVVDLRLLGDRAFSAALVTYATGTFVVFGTFVFVAQYLQLVLDLDTLRAGLWSTPSALAFIVGAMLAPRLAQRFGAATVITAGLWVGVLGLCGLAAVAEARNVVWFVSGAFLFSLGLAPVFTLTTDLVVGCAPPEHAGAASALSETGSELGGALGIAILGSIGTAVYRLALPDDVLAGVHGEVLEAVRGTLGGALEVAQRGVAAGGGGAPGAGAAGAAAGDALANAARHAFVDAVQAIALAAALAVGVAALLTARPLRSSEARAGRLAAHLDVQR